MKTDKAEKIRVQPIKWVFGEPRSFPCFFCDEQKAVKHVDLKKGVAEISVCLCDKCNPLPAGTIWDRFMRNPAPPEAVCARRTEIRASEVGGQRSAVN